MNYRIHYLNIASLISGDMFLAMLGKAAHFGAHP